MSEVYHSIYDIDEGKLIFYLPDLIPLPFISSPSCFQRFSGNFSQSLKLVKLFPFLYFTMTTNPCLSSS